jgi:predicted nuclease with TOPRIM domain
VAERDGLYMALHKQLEELQAETTALQAKLESSQTACEALQESYDLLMEESARDDLVGLALSLIRTADGIGDLRSDQWEVANRRLVPRQQQLCLGHAGTVARTRFRFCYRYGCRLLRGAD